MCSKFSEELYVVIMKYDAKSLRGTDLSLKN